MEREKEIVEREINRWRKERSKYKQIEQQVAGDK